MSRVLRLLLGVLPLLVVTLGFQAPSTALIRRFGDRSCHALAAKITKSRKQQLGINDDEDEYDLSAALNANTDPFITKLIAGSFILVVIALLVVGIIIPATADYGEGVCNPLLTQGRC